MLDDARPTEKTSQYAGGGSTFVQGRASRRSHLPDLPFDRAVLPALRRAAYPWMNLLLNLKRIHLSKSNKTYLFTTPVVTDSSVDKFLPPNAGKSVESYGG